MNKSIYETKFKTIYNNDFIVWLYSNNRLLKLYDDDVIDYPLYRALSLIKGYRGYYTDTTIRSDKYYTDKELFKHLLSNVLFYYRRSNIRLKYKYRKALYEYMQKITKQNRNSFTNGVKYMTSNYIPRKRNHEYNKRVLAS